MEKFCFIIVRTNSHSESDLPVIIKLVGAKQKWGQKYKREHEKLKSEDAYLIVQLHATIIRLQVPTRCGCSLESSIMVNACKLDFYAELTA